MASKVKDANTPASPAPATPDAQSVALQPNGDAAAEVEPDADMTTLVPDTGEASEGGKLKMIVQLLKRCLGVKDLAAMYVS